MYYTKEYLKEQVFLNGWFLGKNGIPAELKTELEQSLVQGGINNKENGFEYTDCEYPEI